MIVGDVYSDGISHLVIIPSLCRVVIIGLKNSWKDKDSSIMK